MMKRVKAILLRAVRPSMALIVLLTLFCATALIYIFAMSLQNTVIGYIVYVLSAYTLIVLVINMPEIASKLRAFIRFGKLSGWVQTIITSNQYGKTTLFLGSIKLSITEQMSKQKKLLQGFIFVMETRKLPKDGAGMA